MLGKSKTVATRKVPHGISAAPSHSQMSPEAREQLDSLYPIREAFRLKREQQLLAQMMAQSPPGRLNVEQLNIKPRQTPATHWGIDQSVLPNHSIYDDSRDYDDEEHSHLNFTTVGTSPVNISSLTPIKDERASRALNRMVDAQAQTVQPKRTVEFSMQTDAYVDDEDGDKDGDVNYTYGNVGVNTDDIEPFYSLYKLKQEESVERMPLPSDAYGQDVYIPPASKVLSDLVSHLNHSQSSANQSVNYPLQNYRPDSSFQGTREPYKVTTGTTTYDKKHLHHHRSPSEKRRRRELQREKEKRKEEKRRRRKEKEILARKEAERRAKEEEEKKNKQRALERERFLQGISRYDIVLDVAEPNSANTSDLLNSSALNNTSYANVILNQSRQGKYPLIPPSNKNALNTSASFIGNTTLPYSVNVNSSVYNQQNNNNQHNESSYYQLNANTKEMTRNVTVPVLSPSRANASLVLRMPLNPAQKREHDLESLSKMRITYADAQHLKDKQRLLLSRIIQNNGHSVDDSVLNGSVLSHFGTNANNADLALNRTGLGTSNIPLSLSSAFSELPLDTTMPMSMHASASKHAVNPYAMPSSAPRPMQAQFKGSCYGCNQRLSDVVVYAAEHSWHKACLRCTNCSRNLLSDGIESANNNINVRLNSSLYDVANNGSNANGNGNLSVTNNGIGIGNESTIQFNSTILNTSNNQDLNKSGVAINDAECIVINGRPYCSESCINDCVCWRCDMNLISRLNPNQRLCIVATLDNVKRKFHANCFKCSSCDGFFSNHRRSNSNIANISALSLSLLEKTKKYSENTQDHDAAYYFTDINRPGRAYCDLCILQPIYDTLQLVDNTIVGV